MKKKLELLKFSKSLHLQIFLQIHKNWQSNHNSVHLDHEFLWIDKTFSDAKIYKNSKYIILFVVFNE